MNSLLNSCLFALAIGLEILAAGSCSVGGSPKSLAPELAALDRAYSAGLMTQPEYEIKKAAFVSLAPDLDVLEKAAAAGAVSRADYATLRARLIAKGAALGALEQAHNTHSVSDQAYATEKASLGTQQPISQGKGTVTYDGVLGDSSRKNAPGAPMQTTVATDTTTSSEGGTFTVSSSLGVSQTGAGSKYVLPSWIPAYPGAATTGNSVTPVEGHTQYSQGLQSRDSLKTVVDFYRTHLTGFKVTQSFLNDTAGYLNMEDSKHKVTLSAGRYPGTPATTFTVNVEDK